MPLLAGLLLALTLLCGACDRSPLVGDDLEEARSAIQAHNWTLAERLLERYLRSQQDPDRRWEAWLKLMEVSGSAGADYRAMVDYLEAMLMEYAEDESRSRDILWRLGEVNENMRRFDRAAEVWSTFIDLGGLTPEEAVEGHRRLAGIHARQRRFEAGEDVLQNCLALAVPDAGKALCLYDLADMNIARERWKDATDLAMQIMDLDVNEKIKGRAAFLLGDALEQQNRLKEALQYFEQARADYPNEMVVENRIAHLKKKLKK